MTEKNKIWAGWIAFIFVVFHIVAISVYTTPRQIMPESVRKTVEPYVLPIFRQEWRMFYPCPTIDGRFKVKVTYEDEEKDWFYPTEEAYKWFNIFRFTHHGELVLLEGNLIHLVAYDLSENDWGFSQKLTLEEEAIFRKGYSYQSVKNYFYGIASRNGKEPVSLDAICELRDVKTGEQGDFKLPTFSWIND